MKIGHFFLGWPFIAFAGTACADVTLTTAQHENLDIQVAAATPVTATIGVPAVARIVDPLPWIKLDGDWRAAASAARAAQREAERARRLHAADSSVSGRALDAADTQASTESARRESLDAERRLTMGATLADMDDTHRQRLLAELARGQARLVRFEPLREVPATTVFDGARLDGATQAVEWLGRAPQANPITLAPGFLGIVRGLDASPGEAIDGRLHTAESVRAAVRVPESAVLRWNAATWIYRQQDPLTFARIGVALLQRLDDGAWLATGVQAGDAIVVAGADALLTADLGRASIGGEP